MSICLFKMLDVNNTEISLSASLQLYNRVSHSLDSNDIEGFVNTIPFHQDDRRVLCRGAQKKIIDERKKE